MLQGRWIQCLLFLHDRSCLPMGLNLKVALCVLSQFSCVWPFATLWTVASAAKSLQSCPTLRDPRWQPTRLPRPWDSPGKNTGVGCHCLLQCMKVKSESEAAQSCPALSDLMDCSPPGSSVHGIFQARILEWGAIHPNSEFKFLQNLSLRILSWLGP